jgi:SAM-dependent methyltransferase
MSIARIVNRVMSVPGTWDLVQIVLGAPSFKKELYLSVLHPPGRLLDFGCANGHLSDAFEAFEYYGLDLDKVAITVAKERHRGRPNLNFLAADLKTRPFPEGHFDEILFACTAHHLDDETLGSLMAELHYCLKPHGVIHLFDPVFREPILWSHRLMRWMDQGKYPRTLQQILEAIERLGLFEHDQPSFHRPRGALLQDCDVVHLALSKAEQIPSLS